MLVDADAGADSEVGVGGAVVPAEAGGTAAGETGLVVGAGLVAGGVVVDGGRVVGGGDGSASDGGMLGVAWVPNAKASMLPAAGL